MKITIQHYEETASLEVPDGAPLDDFRDALIRILHIMWLPEQVADIMRVKDWEEGYAAGLAKALEEKNDDIQNTTT